MKGKILALNISLILLITSCSEKHLINDPVFRERVKRDFSGRKETALRREKDLFRWTTGKLTLEETEAMEFLYAYMPLSDLADYDGAFFLSNTWFALKTRVDREWGNSVPEGIFLHYVLPVRVNNENLDSFRLRYYNEISARIKGLDEKTAALEVNHWCHEKVSYQPSDDRTSAPMSTILSARGRCGEESTFTVSALRTAGIPARQVYTPRWAHSDDNHAWVEVWIDGTWYYMGACEPDVMLDRGWFTEPARRAMLIHTKSFGAPFGEENQIVTHRNYSLINNLSKYAVTKTIYVRTLDPSGKPIMGSDVEFQLYNYSEFYPLATLRTDSAGLCHFETGLGDLMIWAHKGDNYNFRKIEVINTDTLDLQLDRKPETETHYNYDLSVPVIRTPYEGPSQDQVKKNGERLDAENNLRQAYIATWMKPAEAVKLALQKGADTTAVKDLISRSMGNYRHISSFLSNTRNEDIPLAVRLLSVIADKDLRDVSEAVLRDHLEGISEFKGSADENIFYNYILNPRIANEILSPWRSFLKANLPSEVEDGETAVRYVSQNISVDDSNNYYRTPLTPLGTDKLRIADSFSRDLYFIAICRTLGIPARLEPGTSLPQYYSTGKWIDVNFAKSQSKEGPRAFLSFSSDDKNPVPEYYIHFTLARFENGRYNTLEYDFNRKISDFKAELPVIPGFYMLVTGNRINDSRILSSVTFFELKANDHKKLKVTLRKENTPVEILGKISPGSEIAMQDGTRRSIKDLAERGAVLAWIEPDREPTKHIMNDLPLLKTELDKWGGYFIFLTTETGKGKASSAAGYKNLPDKSVFALDSDSELLKQICQGGSCTNIRFPLVLLVRNDGSIIFRSEGYRIGIGEQILRNVH